MKPKGKRITLLAGLVLVFGLAIAAWVYTEHIRFWWLFKSIGRNEFGLPEFRHRQTGIVMV